ncbi:hypothetical protein [Simkania sp.]|uniref:hypothetical protein n=1 Tax=Simkania sp. TaxID=34094 RepID=UPI003B51657A
MIATFAEKIGQINAQLEDGGKGTPFTVALYTMSLLTDLRAQLSPETLHRSAKRACRPRHHRR